MSTTQTQAITPQLHLNLAVHPADNGDGANAGDLLEAAGLTLTGGNS